MESFSLPLGDGRYKKLESETEKETTVQKFQNVRQ